MNSSTINIHIVFRGNELTEITRWEEAVHSYQRKQLIDLKSSDKENCLYINSYETNCVLKITREADDQYKIIKWLSIDFKPTNLSVSNDGQLLLINYSTLMIYGSDAEFIRSIQLPGEIENASYAMETSLGNFIIIHESNEIKSMKDEEDKKKMMKSKEKELGERGSIGGTSTEQFEMKDELMFLSDEESMFDMDKEQWEKIVSKSEWCISEVTRDGQLVSRSSNETHSIRGFSLDSDDRVFVSYTNNERVILFDSDLKRSRILCTTKEEDDDEETETIWSWRLCYDEEKTQLIVGRYSGLNIYTLSHI